MPASRRNAATTRLPRSCPSRPILVTSTLGGWTVLVGIIMHPGYGTPIYGEPPPDQSEGVSSRGRAQEEKVMWLRSLVLFLGGGVLGPGFGVALGFFLFPFVFPPPPASDQLTETDRGSPII